MNIRERQRQTAPSAPSLNFRNIRYKIHQSSNTAGSVEWPSSKEIDYTE